MPTPPCLLAVLLCILGALAGPASARAGGAHTAPSEAKLAADDRRALPLSAARAGGASADAARGGSADPRRSGALAYGTPERQRPVARVFRVAPGTVREGVRPTLLVRIDEAGVPAVTARVVAVHASTRRTGARFDLGRMRTGRTLRLSWPKHALPPAGTWVVRLHAKDPQGAVLARAAASTGKTRLVVTPRPEPKRAPAPPPRPAPAREDVPAAAPAPAQDGVFPVLGPHALGGEDSRFGARRPRHVHEGQDIGAAEGTPVVSPLPGRVAFVDEQPRGAGVYVVVDFDDGRSAFFAHLQAGSVGVHPGDRVSAGQAIGRVGTTGSSSGPHLHFELWQGGWRDRGGRPIDPLPLLLAWDR